MSEKANEEKKYHDAYAVVRMRKDILEKGKEKTYDLWLCVKVLNVYKKIEDCEVEIERLKKHNGNAYHYFMDHVHIIN